MENHEEPAADWSQAEWSRSTFCGDTTCLEVSRLGDQVAIRDSSQPGSPLIVLPVGHWQAFAAGLRSGDFDHIATIP